MQSPSKRPMRAGQVEGRGQPGQCTVKEREGWGVMQEVGYPGEIASSPHEGSGGDMGPPGAAGTSFSG